jgi:hypothetical protein
MALEMHTAAKDDRRISTLGVRAWKVIIFFKLFQMEFDMIPSFVYRGEVGKSDFVWLFCIPEAEDTLHSRAGLGKWQALWRCAYIWIPQDRSGLCRSGLSFFRHKATSVFAVQIR